MLVAVVDVESYELMVKVVELMTERDGNLDDCGVDVGSLSEYSKYYIIDHEIHVL